MCSTSRLHSNASHAIRKVFMRMLMKISGGISTRESFSPTRKLNYIAGNCDKALSLPSWWVIKHSAISLFISYCFRLSWQSLDWLHHRLQLLIAHDSCSRDLECCKNVAQSGLFCTLQKENWGAREANDKHVGGSVLCKQNFLCHLRCWIFYEHTPKHKTPTQTRPSRCRWSAIANRKPHDMWLVVRP